MHLVPFLTALPILGAMCLGTVMLAVAEPFALVFFPDVEYCDEP